MPKTINNHLDIFVPQHFYESLPVYVFGLCKNVGGNDCFVNCTISVDTDSQTNLHSLTQTVQEFNKRRDRDNNFKACLGLLYQRDAISTSNVQKLECPVFLLEVGEVKKVVLVNWQTKHPEKQLLSSSVITYNSQHLYSAELLVSGLQNSFVNFLCDTWTVTESVARDFEPGKYEFCVEPSRQGYIRDKIIYFLLLLLTVLCGVCDWWTQRMSSLAQKLLSVTTTGKQLTCKSRLFKAILMDLSRNRKITLLSGNLLSALVLDAACGLLLTCFLQEFLQPVALVETAIDQTDVVVNQLQELLYWLMGVPAGLKLNLPLNSALGRFFLYHIYLWKTYIVLIKPMLLVMLEFSMHFGIFGLSFLISLCTDFVSLATLHIYCFYGYAARIYSLMLSGLIAFWRLFRGKKWNPLRNRVDSFTYDVQQLFLGTLIFTVTIFLLPTVALYYAVFTVLRLLVLVLQILLCKIIDLLTKFPVYTLLLHFADHPLVKGDIYLTVMSSTPGTISLSLQVISIPITTVFRKTLPTENFCSVPGFNEILNHIIFGNVIYPL